MLFRKYLKLSQHIVLLAICITKSVYATLPSPDEVGTLNGEQLRLRYHGDADENTIALAFIAEGYTQNEEEAFYDCVESFSDGLFEKEPFSSYSSRFTVMSIFVESVDSGISSSFPLDKDTFFSLVKKIHG